MQTQAHVCSNQGPVLVREPQSGWAEAETSLKAQIALKFGACLSQVWFPLVMLCHKMLQYLFCKHPSSTFSPTETKSLVLHAAVAIFPL